MPPPPRHQSPAAEGLLAVAPMVTRWMERLLAAHDPPLTLAQYLGLREIARDGAGGSEIAQRIGVSGPAVSQLIATLSGAGLVESAPVAGDRRRQRVALSTAGSRAFRSAESLIRRRLGSLLTDLPQPEIDALARALPSVEAALQGRPPPRRPPRPSPLPPGRARGHRRRP